VFFQEIFLFLDKKNPPFSLFFIIYPLKEKFWAFFISRLYFIFILDTKRLIGRAVRKISLDSATLKSKKPNDIPASAYNLICPFVVARKKQNTEKAVTIQKNKSLIKVLSFELQKTNLINRSIS